MSKKYRPYLTEKDIEHILHLARIDTPPNKESTRVIRILAPYMIKIQNDCINPSYKATPRATVLESIGGEKEQPKDYVDLPTLLLSAYTKWVDNPMMCTIAELDRAYEYRVANNLLTPKEMEKEDKAWEDIDMSKYTTIEDSSNDI